MGFLVAVEGSHTFDSGDNLSITYREIIDNLFIGYSCWHMLSISYAMTVEGSTDKVIDTNN